MYKLFNFTIYSSASGNSINHYQGYVHYDRFYICVSIVNKITEMEKELNKNCRVKTRYIKTIDKRWEDEIIKKKMKMPYPHHQKTKKNKKTRQRNILAQDRHNLFDNNYERRKYTVVQKFLIRFSPETRNNPK